MSERIDKTIISPYPPDTLDSMWYDGEKFRIFNNGEWNEIGGSGAGVTIVDSIDKLDENAPIGSLAVVASGEGEYQTFSELCTMVPPMDGDSGMTEEDNMEILKNLPIVTDIKFNIPNQISSEVQGILLLVSSEAISESTGNTSMLMLAVMSQGVMCAMEGAEGAVGPITILLFNEETQKYELDKSALQEFNDLFKSKTWIFLGKDAMSGMIGEMTPVTIAAMDEIFLLLSSNIQANLYIKKGQWQTPYESEFNDLKAKIAAKQSPIKALSVSGDTYYEISPGTFYRIDYINKDTTLKLLGYINGRNLGNYEEYLFLLRTTKTDPINITFIDDNDKQITVKWANQIEFSLEEGYVYVVSIVEGLGVFLKF